MNLGFIREFFRKKPVESVALDEGLLEGFLDESFKEKMLSFNASATQNLSSVESALNSLSSALKAIESKEVRVDEGNQRLRQAVLTSKNEISSKFNALLSGLKPPKGIKLETSFDEAKAYSANALNEFNKSILWFRKNIAYAGIILKEEINELGQASNALNDALLALNKTLNNKELASFFSLKKDLAELKSLSLAINEKTALLAVKQKALENAGGNINELASSLSRLEASKELAGFNALLSEKNSLLDSLAAKRNEARIFFSSVSRQLEKLDSLVSGGNWQLEKNDCVMLSLYTRDLIEASRQDAEGIALKKLVSEAATAMQEGKLHLKPSDYNKKLSALKGFNQGRLAKLVNEAIDLEARHSALSGRMASIKVMDEINSIKEKLSALKKESSQLETDLALTTKAANELIESRKALKEKIRRQLSLISSKKVTLN